MNDSERQELNEQFEKERQKLIAQVEDAREGRNVALHAFFAMQSKLKDAELKWSTYPNGLPMAETLRLLREHCDPAWQEAVKAYRNEPGKPEGKIREKNLLAIIGGLLGMLTNPKTKRDGTRESTPVFGNQGTVIAELDKRFTGMSEANLKGKFAEANKALQGREKSK